MLFTLTITKNNYLNFLELWASLDLLKNKKTNEACYFLRQLKKFCKIAPEFTYQPNLYRWDELWRYDSKHFWEDNTGRCSFRFYNTYFGFSDKVNKFGIIHIDWKSFGIKQVSQNKVKRLCGVPVDYLSIAQQKVIKEQEAKWEEEKLKNKQIELIAELQSIITKKG